MGERPIILWFRQDLRLADHPALTAAVATGQPILPLYVLDDDTPGRWRLGGASRWWLHQSLASLGRALAERGAPLLLRRGVATTVILDLVRATDAVGVYFTRQVEPWWREGERVLEAELPRRGVTVKGFAGATLFKPETVLSEQGTPFKVFSPFWRACQAAPPPATPLPAPTALKGIGASLEGDDLAAWRLLPTKPDWAGGLRAAWEVGEAAARARLIDFVDQDLVDYRRARDRMEPGVSARLSPHLHFGEISPRQVWHASADRAAAEPGVDAEPFLRQLAWREFYWLITRDRPDVAEVPLQPRFAEFPWAVDEAALEAWRRGRTGYPLVDAGMRQLWHVGWMHNRARLVVASFLIKHLLLPWQEGEAWFWDTLVDADLANNAGGWQWVAGCGTDAAPYFRVFNPVNQGEKFDPEGAYVRRWVPELAGLPIRVLHKPWQASPLELTAAGVRLGVDYPLPIVEHAEARARALAAFATLSR